MSVTPPQVASDAEAAKNRLSTDTLGWSDIENWAESSGSQYALSVSGGVGKRTDSGGVVATTGESQTGGYQGSSGGKPSMSMANYTQRVTSTTHSAVAEGDVMVRDSANQQQDVGTLSRDTAHAHSALDNNFDRDGIRDKLEIQQQATALGTQAMTAYAESQQDAAKQQARDEMAASGELDGLSEPEIEQRVLASPTFKKAESEYGVGSPFWTAGSSVSGLLAGVLGGNVQSGTAASAAPVLARLIKDASGENEGARIALHTLASAVLAKAQGGSAEAGAVGGFIAAAGAKTFAQAIYGKDAEELAPDEKTVILNLVAALGAAGGGVATGDTSGMVSAGNAARVEVENNYLSVSEKSELEIAKQKLRNSKDPEERERAEKDVARLTELDISRNKKVIAACSNGAAGSAACAASRVEAYQFKAEYENTGNYNSRASQQYADAYGQIVNLLNITSVDAQNQQQVKDAMVNYAMQQLGVDKATAEQYVSTYDGMKIVAASVTPVLGTAASSKLSSLVNKVVPPQSSQSSQVIKSYGPHELGPLGNPNDLRAPASTFRSGSYTEKVAETDVYLYRDYGGSARVDGRYWTPEPSKGPLQSQLDSAVLPEWGNTFQNQAMIKIPKGTKYYEGPAAAQTGTKETYTTLYGGGTQIFLPNPNNEWIIKK